MQHKASFLDRQQTVLERLYITARPKYIQGVPVPTPEKTKESSEGGGAKLLFLQKMLCFLLMSHRTTNIVTGHQD